MYHYGSYKIVFDSDKISCLLTLHNLSSGAAAAATNYDDLVLAVHHHRYVIMPHLAEEKYTFLS